MANILRLGFKSFFPDEERKDYSDYVKGISSKMIVQLSSLLNISLLHSGNSLETQNFLMKKILVSLDATDKQKIVPSVAESLKNPSNAIINRVANLKIIEKELNNFRKVEKEDNTGEMTLNFFKAYLVINDEIDQEQIANRNLDETKKTTNLHEFALIHLLPPHLPYFEIISKDFDFEYQFELSSALMNYLEFNEKYSANFKTFLDERGVQDGGEYLYRIMEVIVHYFKMASEEKNLLNFNKVSLKEAPRIFDALSGNLNTDYFPDPKKSKGGKSDFTKIRAKPILKLEEDALLILDLQFLFDKIYQGLVFDFLGFLKKVEKNEKAFEDAKSDISQNFTHTFFYDIVKDCFGSKQNILKFEGVTDFYLRQKKNVFLFEFKDEIIPVSTKFESDYEKIIAGIFEKFVWETKSDKPKGVTQVLNAIEILDSKFNAYDDLSKEVFDETKIAIFPIIVYTDMTLDFPGFNRLLDEEFEKRLKSINAIKFRKINGLIFLNFRILLQYQHCFKNGKISLIDLFASYYEEVERKRINEQFTNPDLDSVFNTLTSSTLFFSNLISKKGCIADASSFQQKVGELIEKYNAS